MSEKDPDFIQIRRALGLITEEDTALVLGLGSVSTLATWRGQNKGPVPVKLGKGVFYTVNGLSQWINASMDEQQAAKQKIAA